MPFAIYQERMRGYNDQGEIEEKICGEKFRGSFRPLSRENFETNNGSPFLGTLVDKMREHHNLLKSLGKARTGEHADFIILGEDGREFAKGIIAGETNWFFKTNRN